MKNISKRKLSRNMWRFNIAERAKPSPNEFRPDDCTMLMVLVDVLVEEQQTLNTRSLCYLTGIAAELLRRVVNPNSASINEHSRDVCASAEAGVDMSLLDALVKIDQVAQEKYSAHDELLRILIGNYGVHRHN